MARQAKLIEKTQKLLHKIRSRVPGYDKVDLRDEVLADNKKVLALVRGQQRRVDSDFGTDVVAQEPELAVDFIVSTFDRHDFDGLGDYGLRMVIQSGLITAFGLLPNDKVEIKEGEYSGLTLEIVSVDESLGELRFEDDPTKILETNISAEVRLSSLV